MSLFDTIKTDAQKSVEGLLGDAFKYQTQKILSSPTLVRISGQAPSGNLSEAQIRQGATGQSAPIPTGNSNGDLANSVTSPWMSNKMLWIGGGLVIVLIAYLLMKKGK